MKKIAWAVVASVLFTVTGGEGAQAFGLFGGSICGNCCDDTSCCDSSVCDALECNDCGNCDSCGICRQSANRCGCLGNMKLLGCLKPSERCFDDFISPMINFVFFEDPRTLTEVRPIFLNHNVPSALGGGSIQLYAMEFRLALTERLSLIAVKDGYIVDKTGGALDTLLDDGWAAVTVGLKYNLIRDVCSGTLASVGATYELPIGSRRALQDVGDGEFHLFATGGQRLLDGNAHVLSSVGLRLPVDNNVQTTSIHWSNHLDVRVTDRIYLLTEVAWWHWTDDADSGMPLGVAGQDLFNLPASDVDGNDLVTQNVGLKFKPNRSVEAGIAYEFPLTAFKDVIDDRFQVEMIFRY